MKDEKLMDDLRNLLAQMQEMETVARKNALRLESNDKLSYYEKGKESTCETLKRKLTQILYETKVEKMKEGSL